MNKKLKVLQVVDEEENVEETPFRRLTRLTQPSIELRDFITYKIQHPIQNLISYENVSSQHKVFLTSISKEQEPNNNEGRNKSGLVQSHKRRTKSSKEK